MAPNNNIQIQIIPETTMIHLYRDDIIEESNTYDLRGHVRLIPIVYKHNTKPAPSVHHVHLRFQGFAQTMLSANFSDSDDEANQSHWCKDSTELTMLDRFLYSARGCSNVTECVLDQETTLTVGTSGDNTLSEVQSIPFRFTLENTHQLPPSIKLPRHLISYYVTAYVHQRKEDECDHCSSLLKKRRTLLKLRHAATAMAKLPITIACHDLRLNRNEPRIRYCGARPNCLQYQVHVSKNFPFDAPSLQFHCTLSASSPSIKVRKLVYFLVQIETYPSKAGRMQPGRGLVPMVETRHRKIGYTEVDVSNVENFDHIPFTLKLTQPHFSQPIDIPSLSIQHKLRVLLHFDGKEKKMALSFPLNFCTRPPEPQPRTFILSRMSSLSLTSASSQCKLPTYLDVMNEGAPPSPFIDDALLY
ncbi:hypothetical protein DM01DRAFT_1175400 [Hesseltinella vesiculosa]|uniref:Arrestin-like N-terminal domain-containing protein n=1 Tax=Hesseltinella vesiculosa TaxID=101127 RepID=A0A1X2G4V2_9FUNG|nr:hypothetical protein DM01DRAFT_1175400 [Hesseltinella vesiculosa]